MRKTSTINNFKDYCNSCFCPEYITKYVSKLSNDEFKSFYLEVKKAASYLLDEDYLFYKMYWIMKYPWNNLSRELFEQLYFNIENYDLSKIISDDKYDELYYEFISFLEDSLTLTDTDPLLNNDSTLPV